MNLNPVEHLSSDEFAWSERIGRMLMWHLLESRQNTSVHDRKQTGTQLDGTNLFPVSVRKCLASVERVYSIYYILIDYMYNEKKESKNHII